MRDRRLQRVEAIVQRQQRVLVEGDDNRLLLLKRQHRRARLSWFARQVGCRSALPPLGDGLRVDPVAIGRRPQALMFWIARRTASVVVALQ